ncbi:putative Phosphatidylglycerol/phosphatidylinositol transfer protein [Sphaerosporella brunnea]|uniref:Phosphatidylglycerol/phosphatidylinositol transfer protein n=1 Tax=Sphaerosporella brunnea TaxID=1250544 RepID=A0A5J5EZQ4_9PEZI|nr:putative Phosphatidylglycerol/phosphatidylinositol transfer protein [Sphaerosporella brunnea]
MKLYSLATLSLFLASSVSAGNLFQQGASLVEFITPTTNVGKQVPGESPLYFCGDSSDDVATIEKVDLLPNPPIPGQTLEIEAVGTLHDAITLGAVVHITVKYGLITLLKESLDLCENAGQVDLECPVNKGKLIIKKSVDIPKQIPPGQYTVIADAFTADDRHITCLTATIRFYS